MQTRLIYAASAVLLAGCSWLEPRDHELTAVLADAPPGEGYVLGGNIDTVQMDAATGVVTVIGWHMLTPRTARQELQIFAPGAASVVRQMSVARPDVVKGVGDEDLLNSGFEVVIQMKPGQTLKRLCVSFNDRHYGERMLYQHSPEQLSCNP